MKLLGYTFGKNTPVNVVKEPEKKVSDFPQVIQQFRTREDIRKLELAIDLADTISSYNREDLHRIYRRILEDPMLTSQWETRKLKTVEKEFRIVNKSGEENEDATNLLEAGWFLDYTHAILDSKMWGFSLVEFGAWDTEKMSFVEWVNERKLRMDAVTVVNRDYVKPESGFVTKQPGLMSPGISWEDPAYSDWLIFEGKSFDHGLLQKIAKYALFKDNVLGNWSEWAEVFGMDVRVGRTDAQGQERKKFATALRDLGANGNGVFNVDDEIDFLGTSRSDAYGVYKELAQYVDEQISKIIFGQDVVSNNTGQVVGTVGENISNLYGTSDAKFLERNINDSLIPLMANLGITQLKGMTFEWDTTEQLSIEEQLDQDVKISQMGFPISAEYIETTYGTELDLPAELQEGVSAEQQKAQAQLKGSVGGVQGLIQIQQSVAMGITSKESGIAMLEEIYGFDKATASLIIGNPKPVPAPVPSPAGPPAVASLSEEMKKLYNLE